MAAEWPEALSHLRLSINVTAADLAVPRFARSMLMIIDEAHFPRERMTIEVTESGLMGDLEAAARVLNQLRAGGCRVAIDDFGNRIFQPRLSQCAACRLSEDRQGLCRRHPALGTGEFWW